MQDSGIKGSPKQIKSLVKAGKDEAEMVHRGLIQKDADTRRREGMVVAILLSMAPPSMSGKGAQK
eukprot:6951963-Karenia_brevis.AAC.1